jgi:transcriptional regulator with GAF, ATPase, and Fis domain
MKRHYVEQALQISGGNKSAAAKLLGLASHQTLNNWMKRLGVESSD